MRRAAWSAAATASVAFVLFACGSVKQRGELMLAMQTDLELPKDVDTVRIEVTAYGKSLFAQNYAVGPGGVKIPATLGIVGDPSSPGSPIEVRVIASQAGTYRVLRDVTTTVPPDRTAILRMPLAWLCWNQVTADSTNTAQSTCPADQTCIAGECVANALDSTELADFDPTQVFGGSSDASGGACLDTIACFANGVIADVDTSDCSIPTPTSTGAGLNVAMIRQPGVPGICSSEACYVPLDEDPQEGWTNTGTKIMLPPAVCNRLTAPATPKLSILGVVVTTSCATKTASVPTCGPWSSVGGGTATFEAGTHQGFDAGPSTNFAGTWFNDGALGTGCDGAPISSTLTITQAGDGSYSVATSIGSVGMLDGTCGIVTTDGIPAMLEPDGTLTYAQPLTSVCSCTSSSDQVTLALSANAILTSTETFSGVAQCPTTTSVADDAGSTGIADATLAPQDAYTSGGGSSSGGSGSGSGSGGSGAPGESFCSTCGGVSCAVTGTFNRIGGSPGEDGGTSAFDASAPETDASTSAGDGGSTVCDPETCSGCCDGTGTCQDGFSNTACGENGISCSNCAALAQTCGGTPAQCTGGPSDAGVADAGGHLPDGG